MTKCFSSQSQEISGVRLLQIFNKHDTLIPTVPSADAESIGILDFYDISWKFLEFFANISLREQSHVTRVGALERANQRTSSDVV